MYGQFVARRSPFAASSPRPILAPPPSPGATATARATQPLRSRLSPPPHHPPSPAPLNRYATAPSGAAQLLRYGALRSGRRERKGGGVYGQFVPRRSPLAAHAPARAGSSRAAADKFGNELN